MNQRREEVTETGHVLDTRAVEVAKSGHYSPSRKVASPHSSARLPRSHWQRRYAIENDGAIPAAANGICQRVAEQARYLISSLMVR